MNKKIGFTCGSFDLLHAGHNLFLEQCKNLCDHLIVGLHTNPKNERTWKNKPIQTIYERFVQLKACKYVDEIIPYDTENDLLNIFATVPMNIRFLGEDYKSSQSDFTGKTLCSEMYIAICYVSRKHNYSSSELRQRIEEAKK